MFALPAHPALAARYDVVFDVATLSGFDASNFRLLRDFLVERMPTLRERTRRFAMVRPAGMIGATMTGLFHDWVRAPMTGDLFEARADAFAWLAVPAADAHALEAMHAAVAGSPLLRRVRDVIDRDLRGATLASAAGELGTSARSLQRHLADHGTAFRDELIHARIAAARRMLLDSNAKLEAIARELGFTSASAFIAMFSRVAGESPDAFRKRR